MSGYQRNTNRVRTGNQYGGTRRSNLTGQQNESIYNDAYYATGTTFDTVGARLNNAGRSRNGARANRGNTNSFGYGQASELNNRGYYSEGNARNPRNSTYRDNATLEKEREMLDAQRQKAEQIETMEFCSATLSGIYHNLDNPKGDIRTFPENGEKEGNEQHEK